MYIHNKGYILLLASQDNILRIIMYVVLYIRHSKLAGQPQNAVVLSNPASLLRIKNYYDKEHPKFFSATKWSNEAYFLVGLLLLTLTQRPLTQRLGLSQRGLASH